MFDRFAAHRPPTIRNLSPRTRRFTIGTAAVIPALLIGVLGSTHSGVCNFVFCDGSVRAIRTSIDPTNLHRFAVRNDGEVITNAD